MEIPHFVRDDVGCYNKAQQLKDDGYHVAASAAHSLDDTIAENARQFFLLEITEQAFKTACAVAINAARPALEAFCWKDILGNLALAILGLGLVYAADCLINKAVTGHFLFFRMDAANKVDALDSKIMDATLLAPVV